MLGLCSSLCIGESQRGVKHAKERKKTGKDLWIFKMAIAHPSFARDPFMFISQGYSCSSLLLDKLRVVIILQITVGDYVIKNLMGWAKHHIINLSEMLLPREPILKL